MAFEIKGQLHKIFETENKTDSFQAREFVISTEDRGYKNFIKFQLTQDRCQVIDRYKVGDQVNVHFDVRGREWNEKYFTNLNAWKIEGSSQEQASSAPDTSAGFPTTESNANQEMQAEDFDDLPF